MSTSRSISFAPLESSSTYSLLALPTSVLSNLMADDTLELRAQGIDSAVLVTSHQTYSIRGVQNSNSVLLCDTRGRVEQLEFDYSGSSGTGEDQPMGRNKRRKLDEIIIETTLHETLELVPSVPRFDKLYGILSGMEYDGEDNEADQMDQPRFTLSSLSSLLPASDAEIRAVLRSSRVVELGDDSVRFIAPAYRLKLLAPLLQSLVAVKRKGKEQEKDKKMIIVAVKLEDMIQTFDALDCSEAVARRVVEWYGAESETQPGFWIMSIEDLVKEIGICVLAEGGHTEQPLKPFIAKWQQHSHSFFPMCLLPLLADTSLLPTSSSIRYFPPSSLSPTPSIRFAELFAIKPRWTESEMIPFVNDLVGGDRKKREAMALKFVRKVVEKGKPISWSARNTW